MFDQKLIVKDGMISIHKETVTTGENVHMEEVVPRPDPDPTTAITDLVFDLQKQLWALELRISNLEKG